MRLADLVSVRVRPSTERVRGEAGTIATKSVRGEARPTAAGDEESKGVFITPQSLVTFPGATFVVAMLNKVVAYLAPQLQNARAVPFVLSILVGAAVYYISFSDPNASQTTRDRLVGAIIALLNSLYLFAATVGITAVFAQQ